MRFRSMLALGALLVAGAGRAEGGKAKLVGSWSSELGGSPLALELRSDGTATFMGATAQWQVIGDTLVVGNNAARYKLSGGKLVLTDTQGRTTVWQRVASARGGKGAPAKPAGGKGSPVDAQLRQLLLSSAWCSFRYNKITGATNQSRAVFRADGTLYLGADAQTYTSGAAGSVAGQYQSGTGMRWSVQNGRLLVDSGEGPQDMNLKVDRNSAGNWILTADGKEYMACG